VSDKFKKRGYFVKDSQSVQKSLQSLIMNVPKLVVISEQIKV